MDVMAFFRACEGRWYSQRVSHHLAFRRQEKGESEITILCLPADHPEVVALCELHQKNPTQAMGAALVTWKGTLQGDNLNHDGRSLMVPIPDDATGRAGTLLRDLGYAESVPVAGQYRLADDDALLLSTCYQQTESEERFSFASENLRFRASTLKNNGGLSMTTFCTEMRLNEGENRPQNVQDRLGTTGEPLKPTSAASYSALGG